MFVINSMMEAQCYLVTAAMMMVDNFHQPAKFILNPLIVKGAPFVYNSEGLRASPEDVAQVFRNIEALYDLSNAPEDD